jgi:hypothetical protein
MQSISMYTFSNHCCQVTSHPSIMSSHSDCSVFTVRASEHPFTVLLDTSTTIDSSCVWDISWIMREGTIHVKFPAQHSRPLHWCRLSCHWLCCTCMSFQKYALSCHTVWKSFYRSVCYLGPYCLKVSVPLKSRVPLTTGNCSVQRRCQWDLIKERANLPKSLVVLVSLVWLMVIVTTVLKSYCVKNHLSLIMWV